MASKSICLGFMVFFFAICFRTTVCPAFFFLLFGSFENVKVYICLKQNSMNFTSFWPSWVVYAPRGLKIASRSPQVGDLEPIWSQFGPKLARVGPKLAPSWPQLGPRWIQNWLQEGPGGCPRGSQEGLGRLLPGAKRPSSTFRGVKMASR